MFPNFSIIYMEHVIRKGTEIFSKSFKYWQVLGKELCQTQNLLEQTKYRQHNFIPKTNKLTLAL